MINFGEGTRAKEKTAAAGPPSGIYSASVDSAQRYFFSSVDVAGGVAVVGGAAVAGGFTGWLACAGASPRIPSLNSRTPCPSPFMTSGILRPPNRTRITTAIINKCMGLSHIGHLPFHTPEAGVPALQMQYSTPAPPAAGALLPPRTRLAPLSAPGLTNA